MTYIGGRRQVVDMVGLFRVRDARSYCDNQRSSGTDWPNAYSTAFKRAVARQATSRNLQPGMHRLGRATSTDTATARPTSTATASPTSCGRTTTDRPPSG